MVWNKERFSIYKSEEKQVLGLIKEIGEQLNYNTEEVEKKTDLTGDHKGTWHGLKPTEVNEAIGGLVVQHDEKLNVNDLKFSFLDKLKLKFVYGILGNGTDETEKLRKAFMNEEVIFIPKGYRIGVSSSIVSTKANYIYSEESELIVLTNGMENIFQFNNMNNIVVKGIKFNDNIKGRTCLDFNNCNNVKVIDNKFTGYSADFSHYATDSAIRVSGKSENIYILKNEFIDFGYQYDHSGETLNRAITINDNTCKKVFIKDNIFNNINQGIVFLGENINIINNYFENIHDNCLYFSANNVFIDGNTLINKNDENIVFGGNNITISNNKIYESPNKALAVNGNCNNLIIINNDIRNENTLAGQFFNYRNFAYTITNFIFRGNKLYQANKDTYGAMFFGNVLNLIFEDNMIGIPTTTASDKIIIFQGETVTKGVVRNNQISGGNGATACFHIATIPTTYDLLFDNNDISNCRFNPANAKVRNQVGQVNVGPYYSSNNRRSEILSGAIPSVGTWKKGDIIWNSSPTSGSYVGWICITDGTPGTWKGFGTIQT